MNIEEVADYVDQYQADNCIYCSNSECEGSYEEITTKCDPILPITPKQSIKIPNKPPKKPLIKPKIAIRKIRK